VVENGIAGPANQERTSASVKRLHINHRNPPVWWLIHSLPLGIICLLFTSLAACGGLREPQPAAQPNPILPIVHVTSDQIARAMQEDRFFAVYGQTTLLIQGTVLSVNQQGNDLVVALDTSLSIKVLCDIGSQSAAVHVGDTITVKSAYPERDASRQPSAVMLKNCSIP